MRGWVDRSMAALTAVLASLVAVASGAGVFARGDGSVALVTNERGVTFEMATSGVYAYNAQRVVAEGIGWDAFTLAVVVPALLLAAVALGRGAVRATLPTLGLYGYLLYAYLEYSVTWALGPLFPVHVAIVAGSVVGLFVLGYRFATDSRGSLGDVPRRAWVGLNVGMAALLTLMWSARIAEALRGDLATAGLTSETTMTVQALDLGLVVPVCLTSAWLVWRRSPLGAPVAAAWSIVFTLMAAAIVAMLLSAALVEGTLELPPVLIFAVAGICAALIAARIHQPAAVRTTLHPAHHPA